MLWNISLCVKGMIFRGLFRIGSPMPISLVGGGGMGYRSLVFVVSILVFTQLSSLAFAGSQLSPGEQRALREKYSYLYQEVPHRVVDGSVAFHQGRLFQKNSFNVLYLRGDSFEMAFQHAVLLKDQIAEGALMLTSNTIANTAANTLPTLPALARIATKLINKFITGGMFNYASKQLPTQMEAYKETAFAMSEGSGISTDVFIRAALSPETLMILSKLTIKNGVFPSTAGELSSACSAFAAWGPYTKDGGLVIGRNLDFPLNGYFEKHRTLIYFDPTPGNGQKVLAVTSAGLHNPAITGLNESGIYIALHTIPTTEASIRGVPVFVTGTQVLFKAKTFDEAVALFKQNPPPTGWTYDLISTHEGRVGGVEMSNAGVTVRESFGGIHVQTNHYLTPEMKPQQLSVNYSVDEDSIARYSRVKQIVEALKGKMDAAAATTVLSDHVDGASGTLRGVGNTVSVHTTIASIVFVPGDKTMYVASGEAPVSENAYYGFPVPEMFDVNTFGTESSARASEALVLAGSTFRQDHPDMAQAEQSFILAKEAYEFNNDSKGAFALMQQAVRKDPSNPHYYFVLAILGLRAGQPDAARQGFESILKVNPSDHQKNLALYYLGRMDAAEGNGASAIEGFQAILDDSAAYGKLQAAAETALEKVTRFGSYSFEIQNLSLMIQQGDMEHY